MEADPPITFERKLGRNHLAKFLLVVLDDLGYIDWEPKRAIHGVEHSEFLVGCIDELLEKYEEFLHFGDDDLQLIEDYTGYSVNAEQ